MSDESTQTERPLVGDDVDSRDEERIDDRNVERLR